MSSPLFYVKVLEKRDATVRFRVSVVADGGFDVDDKRDVLKLVGFGGDFLFPDGHVDHVWEERSVIARQVDFESQLWNDGWVEANASRYVAQARLVSETNHPWSSERVFSPSMAAARVVRTYADAEAHFALAEYPHCLVEVTVTDAAFVTHLEVGMVYSFY